MTTRTRFLSLARSSGARGSGSPRNRVISTRPAYLIALLTLAAVIPRPALGAAGTGPIGVYDSRAVAFAYFWSEAGTAARNALIAEAKAAKSSGDSEKARLAAQRVSDLQKRLHLQVFSSAPANEAMAALAEQKPSLKKDLGVTALISKWDAKALDAVPAAQRVDVTDALVAALFRPNEQQRKTLEAMKSSSPLPLEKARELEAAGKM